MPDRTPMTDREKFDLLFEGIAETRSLTNSNAVQIREMRDGITELGEKVEALGEKVEGLGEKVEGLGEHMERNHDRTQAELDTLGDLVHVTIAEMREDRKETRLLRAKISEHFR